jgi:hypothetical protein
MVKNASDESRQQMLREALSQLQASLQLLDEAAAPGHLGAQLDHLIHQLGSFLSEDSASIRSADQGTVRH